MKLLDGMINFLYWVFIFLLAICLGFALWVSQVKAFTFNRTMIVNTKYGQLVLDCDETSECYMGGKADKSDVVFDSKVDGPLSKSDRAKSGYLKKSFFGGLTEDDELKVEYLAKKQKEADERIAKRAAVERIKRANVDAMTDEEKNQLLKDIRTVQFGD